jgi:hypothetical protein
VDAINAVDASGANCHMSTVGICALLTRMGYAPVLPDRLPRPQPHRHPGRRAGRGRPMGVGRTCSA